MSGGSSSTPGVTAIGYYHYSGFWSHVLTSCTPGVGYKATCPFPGGYIPNAVVMPPKLSFLNSTANAMPMTPLCLLEIFHTQ